jgi:putative membrane-bound dehydrogenase-like protein
MRRILASAVLVLLVGGGSLARRADGPPYSPADSMATMQVEAGYRIELVASEPDLESPVAMDFDEQGRLFVVEMPGYPLDTQPTGRIKLLEDTDGDGRYETSRVFADKLVLPTGVMRWKKGVLVTAAPDLLYLEDTDGDGRADVRTVVITGFAFTNPQHMVNGPLYGLDNWIYLAHEGPATAVIYKDVFGDRGTPLRWPDRPQAPTLVTPRRGVRLRPDARQLEAIAGASQYGHGFDAWGRYFTTENADHARHEVMPAAWLARNPELLLDSAMARIPDHGAAAQVFPITRRPTFELLTGAGEFTSACAITPYTGGAFPETDGRTSLFVAEPVHNLVHRDVLTPSGATFVAQRAEEGREFLAAGDAWFRPVFLSVGPDGALYVVDYYRPRIEHPEWTSSDLQKDPAPMYEGRDRGRLYRVVRAGAAASRPPAPNLGAASDADLVRALESPNLWWRRTAQRLLVDRRSRQAIGPLKALAANPAAPLGRVHALWTLDGLDALDDVSIASAMRDGSPGVRENAVRLAEPRLRASPSLASGLVALAGEPDPRVRFVVLGALGWLTTPEAAAARRTLLFAHLDDLWMQRAALSAGSDQAPALFDAVVSDASAAPGGGSASRAAFVRQVASIVAAREKPAEVKRIVDAVAAGGTGASWWRGAALDGLAQGARGRRSARTLLQDARANLLALYVDASPDVRAGSLALLRLAGPGKDAAWESAIQQAIEAADRGTDAQRRADAVTLVALDRPKDRIPWLEGFVSPHEPEAVQVAAVTALGRIEAEPSASQAIGRFLLTHWAAFTPEVRSHAADVLLADPPRARLLVEALTNGTVPPWSLGFWQKQDLVLHEEPSIRAAARAVLEEDPKKRLETVRRYAAALDLEGEPARGAQVFTRACAACHRLGGTAGGDLGPDLATVRHRPPASLLADILLPSRSIAQHFETYVVERSDGDTVAGVLGAETAATITLRQGGDRAVVIRRAEIRKMTVSPQSTMPADLDTIVAPADMADLLAFIRRP